MSTARRSGAAIVVVSLGVAASLMAPGVGAFADSTTTTTSTTTSTTLPTSSTTTSISQPTTTTTIKKPVVKKKRWGPTLVEGDQGPLVVTRQRRLASLGYWLGQPNGYFGDSTVQAVYAFQKAAGVNPDGDVGPVTQAALLRGVKPTPRPATGDLVEINLGKDLLMIIKNGKLATTLNTSTGGGYTYFDQGSTSVAITPTGVFHVYRQVDGIVVDTLGELWRPKYFDSGFAIHGDSYVPSVPVSHGCVRVSNEAINWIWASDQLPIGTEVWVYQ